MAWRRRGTQGRRAKGQALPPRMTAASASATHGQASVGTGRPGRGVASKTPASATGSSRMGASPCAQPAGQAASAMPAVASASPEICPLVSPEIAVQPRPSAHSCQASRGSRRRGARAPSRAGAPPGGGRSAMVMKIRLSASRRSVQPGSTVRRRSAPWSGPRRASQSAASTASPSSRFASGPRQARALSIGSGSGRQQPGDRHARSARARRAGPGCPVARQPRGRRRRAAG